MRGYVDDQTWMRGRIEALPGPWQRRLESKWRGMYGRSIFDANTFLRKQTDALAAVRIPIDASDDEICGAAQALALRCAELATRRHDAQALRQAMEKVVERQGIEPPADKVRTGPAIARMACELWWRRKLRRHHGRAVEASAIALGIVNKRAEIYCSNETLRRRQKQNTRNAAALEATIARNELGQEYTLAELAAKGPANKAIKRAELMTRIAGFERIARDMGHAGLFLTITCPSRMHPWRTVGGWKVEQNPRYDNETTPRTAQAYLAKVWARIRAQLHRIGSKLYGFRIAEPQHDGTPHWHLLVFHKPEHADAIRASVTKHALRDSPNEPGAHAHRVDFRVIDWEKGSAAGYIAKYVAKNIDGYRVEADLHGNPAMETSARVEAWATTWGIRQFQQVGGPPVGPWRELRRIEALPSGAPDHLIKAHNAVNRLAVIEGREHASVAWDHYCHAQGGVFCGRDYRVRLSQVQDAGLNRYGEEAAPRTVGVETVGIEHYTPEHMKHMRQAPQIPRAVLWEVESTRYKWEIVGRAPAHGMGAIAAAKLAPWTRVNNCTEGGSHGDRINEGAPCAMRERLPERGGHGQKPTGPIHAAHASIHGAGSGPDRAGDNRAREHSHEPCRPQFGGAPWQQ
ncbi:replication endonuclease [Simplicispira suum]|uniref:Replication endonuclease n=1 Tax=Simplicispira suum TaxID=2109915 RepID=A0A2S0N3P7_9BURK|nr:replication endonuclease [Simplicispira suum]AVO42736.1 replication endonuclease [Simplicispira suum]